MFTFLIYGSITDKLPYAMGMKMKLQECVGVYNRKKKEV
ncbi:MAG: hypothetical protein RHS_1100 [Robinsoniella sp. RHS]|nr:MAG: hypothetical protein RHS_1100 [Robinsoniella sp. RHS]